MAGIFRQTYAGHNNSYDAGAPLTPNKRFSFSAFSTRPGTLQNATMDTSYGAGFRSPGFALQHQTSMSPTTQGRSVREFEEQMAALRKENFNLKLRLYFIEESLPGFQQNNGADAQESAMREVIETKVQMEIFRKELEEKQDLLKDAAVALNQMEQLQKDAEVKYQSIIDELQQKVHYLEMENEIEKSGRTHLEYINHQDARTELSEDSNDLQKICELENWRQNAAERENQLKENISTLNKELAKRDEMIKRFEENIKKLSFQNEELLEAIESKDKVMDANKNCLEELLQVNSSLRMRNESCERTVQSLEGKRQDVQAKLESYKKLVQSQANQLEYLQTTLTFRSSNTTKLLERIKEYEELAAQVSHNHEEKVGQNRFFKILMNKLTEKCKEKPGRKLELEYLAPVSHNSGMHVSLPSSNHSQNVEENTIKFEELSFISDSETNSSANFQSTRTSSMASMSDVENADDDLHNSCDSVYEKIQDFNSQLHDQQDQHGINAIHMQNEDQDMIYKDNGGGDASILLYKTKADFQYSTQSENSASFTSKQTSNRELISKAQRTKHFRHVQNFCKAAASGQRSGSL